MTNEKQSFDNASCCKHAHILTQILALTTLPELKMSLTVAICPQLQMPVQSQWELVTSSCDILLCRSLNWMQSSEKVSVHALTSLEWILTEGRQLAS